MNITCSNEINTSPCSVSIFRSSRAEYDVLADIRREDSRKAQARKNARKQRARELTKARELEIKKSKGEVK
jgi:hypothetical protein